MSLIDILLKKENIELTHVFVNFIVSIRPYPIAEASKHEVANHQ